MKRKQVITIDNVTGEPIPLPLRYRAKLETVGDVRKELAKLYRETRSGLVDPTIATKLAWLLGEVRKSIDDAPNTETAKPLTFADHYKDVDMEQLAKSLLEKI